MILNLVMLFFLTMMGVAEGNVKKKFQEEEIDKDLGISAPNKLLQVSYGGNSVQPGDTLQQGDTKQAPNVAWDAVRGNRVTLMMVDPDAPSRSTHQARSWLHWLVVNINGNDVANGKTLVDYQGPTPPAGTGAHRYVLLVFTQSGSIGNLNIERPKFNVAEFVQKHSLNGPLNGNFYKVVG